MPTHVELATQVARMQGESDGFIADTSRRINRLEDDMKAVRSWQDQWTGKLVIMVTVATFAASLLGGFVMRQLSGVP